jgi:organic radical activating enzyme
MDTTKVRIFPDKNYAATFDGFTTVRFQLDGDKPIEKLDYFEALDVAINDKCFGGCPYCYTDAKANGRNFSNVVDRLFKYFAAMSKNERPFQVAIGGAGEPTLHPDFPLVLEAFTELGILPNYTTNGMHLTPEVLEATATYAGGVAVSTHEHIDWKHAVRQLRPYAKTLHLHIIISDAASIQRFVEIYEEFEDIVDAFILLPYKPVGRAGEKDVNIEFCLDVLEAGEFPKVAYGAYFYEALKSRPGLNPSLYEPHHFSAYLIADENMTVYDNSFDMVPL